MKTYSFPAPYGAFTQHLIYGGNLGLKVKIAHKNTIFVDMSNGSVIQISCICATTPKTYSSGNREYGKYIFVVPDNVSVIKNEFMGSSNDDAYKKNKSSLRGGCYSSNSFGFDFYEITRVGNEEVFFEVSKKIEIQTLNGFGDLDESIFISEAMSDNLSEIIPNFPHQTSGWKRNSEETHLHAVTKIKGIDCFIPFASSNSEIEYMCGIKTTFLKQIVFKNDDSIDLS